MILAKFNYLDPGNHHEISKGKIPAVPREGETVLLNDVVYRVHSVMWDFTKMEVRVNIHK
jgi:hypothetical protein